MKKKFVFISISLFSILILICIQIFLISKIYKLESEKFDYRFREIVNEAMDKLMLETNSNGLTKPFFILERASDKFLAYLHSKRDIDTLSFRKAIFKNFGETIKKYQDIDKGVENYLKKGKIQEPFISYFQIRDLKLFDKRDALSIISKKSESLSDSLANTIVPLGAILVNHYQFEGDNFRIDLEYYVDFSNKKNEVISQVFKSGLLAVISLVIVVIVFLLTLRNLLRESRLSQMKTDFY